MILIMGNVLDQLANRKLEKLQIVINLELEYISNEHIINYNRIVFDKYKTAENSEIFQNSDDILILENNFHGEKIHLT